MRSHCGSATECIHNDKLGLPNRITPTGKEDSNNPNPKQSNYTNREVMKCAREADIPIETSAKAGNAISQND